MRLVHYTSRPITKISGRRQIDNSVAKQKRHAGIGKPCGFWLSDESDYGWRKWCQDNDFRRYGLRYEYEIKLSPKARILYIRTTEELDAFTEKYRDETSITNNLIAHIGPDFGMQSDTIDLDWRRVAKKYQGIIITPYNWNRRLENGFTWYYGWDCASGCIWNARAIESFTLVRERKTPKEPTRWQLARRHKRDMIRMAQTSKALINDIAKTRPRSKLDDAVVEAADNLIKSYGGSDGKTD